MIKLSIDCQAPVWDRLAATVLMILAALALGGCQTPPSPRDYTAFKQARPASLLVLPPINDTPDVLATPSVFAQLSFPLAESGFYVLPVSLVDETLKANGMHTAADAHQIAPAKLREIFGADAVLYVAVKSYGAVYKLVQSEALVVLDAKLVDLKSGQMLWEGSARASSAEQGGSNQGGLVGLLVKAVIEQIANNVSERSHPIAGIASQRLLGAGRPNGLLYGPRSPNYMKQP
ncbi:DUF799 domain-containing protein [Ideonella sp. A 288]|uniref:DUF799 domain-containing protein n=1 Tax=Ideonella sp. A 288 TaxID=1962181 RepID=UPI0018FEBC4F|nr:DUF799 domain-containing protein [Ideonella sp. A 288]